MEREDRLSLYDYRLPPERIAQTPLDDRAASKLLWVHRADGHLTHHVFREIPSILRPGDLLVMNDTRVTALRLMGRKPTGGEVEVLLLRESGDHEFVALARPGRRLQPGARILFDDDLAATVLENLDMRKRIRFDPVDGLHRRLQACGRVPLPPYIHEPLSHPERYQTVYASRGGSAAAPTAGLHFTPEILAQLQAMGVSIAKVTLDVGLDTFRPIESEDVSDHVMHGERCTVPPETVDAVAACEGRVVAVGTTTVRTLETFALGRRALRTGVEESRLFIRPGFRFQIVDGMFTNFHMPRTTMLMMISAMAGRESVMKAYEVALQSDYRFLSFGDSMLIL